jgi:hypothetical protein
MFPAIFKGCYMNRQPRIKDAITKTRFKKKHAPDSTYVTKSCTNGVNTKRNNSKIPKKNTLTYQNKKYRR